MLLIKLGLALSLLWAQSDPQTWAEIESHISGLNIKKTKLEQEKALLVKERSRGVSIERHQEISKTLKDLEEQLGEIQDDWEESERKLQFRFPERGLKMKEAGLTMDPSPEGEASDSAAVSDKAKVFDEKKAKVEGQAIPKALELLRRQHGYEKSKKTKVPLKEGAKGPSGDAISELPKEPHPIQDKLILSK